MLSYGCLGSFMSLAMFLRTPLIFPEFVSFCLPRVAGDFCVSLSSDNLTCSPCLVCMLCPDVAETWIHIAASQDTRCPGGGQGMCEQQHVGTPTKSGKGNEMEKPVGMPQTLESMHSFLIISIFRGFLETPWYSRVSKWCLLTEENRKCSDIL